MTRHRLFLVSTRPDLPVDTTIDHWEQQHGAIFAATPDLAGYVQHQPTRVEQHRLGGRVCAEAWFEDREAEARAFGSEHYRDEVVPDEDRFIDRSRAWTGLVHRDATTGVAGSAHADRGLEVVAVGCDPASVPAGAPARILDMDRPGPDGGAPTVVLAPVSDETVGHALLGQLVADVAFIAHRTPVKPPPTS